MSLAQISVAERFRGVPDYELDQEEEEEGDARISPAELDQLGTFLGRPILRKAALSEAPAAPATRRSVKLPNWLLPIVGTIANIASVTILGLMVHSVSSTLKFNGLFLMYIGLIVSYLCVEAAIIREAFASRRLFADVSAAPLLLNGSATAIIAAHLPSEPILQIVETVSAWRSLAGITEVILACNGAGAPAIRSALAQFDPSDGGARVCVLHLGDEGGSKAANINAALAMVKTDYLVVLDADHVPGSAEVAERALYQLAIAGFDCVQGRCVVGHEDAAGLLQRLVGVEFDILYGVAHPGRTQVSGFGLFGGSNGWWRTATLRQVGFDLTMLTEDIDCATRALIGRAKITYNPLITTIEAAPASWSAHLRQRLRWCQGWTEVRARHKVELRRWQKDPERPERGVSWLYVWLGWWPLLAWAMPGILVARVVVEGPSAIHWWHPIFGPLTIVTWAGGWALAYFGYRVRAPWRSRKDFLIGALLAVPYSGYLSSIALGAFVRHLAGDRRWQPTGRV